MFLVDTNVLSEQRRGSKANSGVLSFFRTAGKNVFLPVQVLGELRYGIEKLKRKGDLPQAQVLEEWFQSVLEEYAQRILVFDLNAAKIWGDFMGASDQHIVDKQIAAIAMVYDLTVVTRNTNDFNGTGVRLLNPFHRDAVSGKPPTRRRSHL